MFVNQTFKNEIVSYTDSDRPKKDIITDDLLFKADTFSFGTKIGAITNKGSALFALLDNFEEGSDEYNTILTRLKTLPCIQNKEIDKTKNGNKTKGIPQSWVKYEKGEDFNNSILVDKHPYFFTYLYTDTRRKCRAYQKSFEKKAKQMFGMSLKSVLSLPEDDDRVREFKKLYHHKTPVIESNSVMNRICAKVESISDKVSMNKNDHNDDMVFECYFDNEIYWDWSIYKEVAKGYEEFKKDLQFKNATMNTFFVRSSFFDFDNPLIELELDLKECMFNYCSNEEELVNYMLYYMYKGDGASTNREMIWNTYGNIIYKRVLSSSGEDTFLFPVKHHDGEISYLGSNYKIKEIEIDG